MNSGEVRMCFLAGKANSMYQIPEQDVTANIEEKFQCKFL